MRPLTTEEQELIERRRTSFDDFLAERMPVLTHFMQCLEFPDPPMVLVNANDYSIGLSDWLKQQVIEADDRQWILVRIGYFVGEWLVQKLGGYWFLNEIPDSRYFGRYVVGRFSKSQNPNSMVDPFEVASACLEEPVGRELQRYLLEVEAAIVGSQESKK